jgi:hypothetical protein
MPETLKAWLDEVSLREPGASPYLTIPGSRRARKMLLRLADPDPALVDAIMPYTIGQTEYAAKEALTAAATALMEPKR